MSESQKPKLIILESNESISNHARKVLTRAGWDVQCENVSKSALLQLEESKSRPFNLFISSFKLPKMEGDDILKNARAISPMTQRMLVVPADESDMVIRAINKGGINSCIIYPFQDEDLVNQAKDCLVQFQLSMKHQQLKRITSHQNKQLFQIAQKLKKKDDACQQLIADKKAIKFKLGSSLRNALKQKEQNRELTLGEMIDQKEIPVTPESFQGEFLILCDYIKALFDATASKTKLDPVVLNLQSLLIEKKPTAPAADAAGTSEEAVPNMGAEITQKILKVTLSSPADQGPGAERLNTGDREEENPLDPLFEISLSRDQTKASIRRAKGRSMGITLAAILDFLRNQDITFGIIEDEAIEAWISKGNQELMVARGEDPVTGENGSIKFHFQNDFTNPGKIQEDGTIDFRDRGNIPYVKKGDLLAKKTPIKEGRTGMDIFGTPILVEEPMDPVFVSGSGTETQEEGLEIYAAIDGQPHVDALGTITVNPELMIKGDVDFETGNIDFNGNIVVTGTIKEGFTIKGISLTAQEIEGAEIELSGDLNISAGITEAKIHSVGNVHAKFINHSSVSGFGDLVIQKEIIDSDIIISGACKNPTGHIISSKINAKQGIDAGNIGTPGSKPAVLKVGIDEHIKIATQKIENLLIKSLDLLQALKTKIKLIETQDQGLYETITQKAQIQEIAQNESKAIRQTIPNLKKANDRTGLQNASSQIKKLSETTEQAEQELNQIFETQDLYAKQINQLKEQVRFIEERNKKYVLEKKGLKELSAKTPPLPQVIIKGKIIQDTKIQGPNASIVTRDDLSRCQIQETSIQENGLVFHEMNVTDL